MRAQKTAAVFMAAAMSASARQPMRRSSESLVYFSEDSYIESLRSIKLLILPAQKYSLPTLSSLLIKTSVLAIMRIVTLSQNFRFDAPHHHGL